MMRYLLLLLALFVFFPTEAQAQKTDTTKAEPFVFSVTVPPDRDFTLHYSGTVDSPIGIGAYTTKEGSYGLKFAVRSFYKDDIVTSRFGLQQQDSGVEIIFLPEVSVGATSQQMFTQADRVGRKSFKRTATAGMTRTFDLNSGPFNTASVFLESGLTRSTNYQFAETDGVKVWREHPDGHKQFHPNFGTGVTFRMFDHLSFIGGYSYTAQLSSHDVQFGVGYTFD